MTTQPEDNYEALDDDTVATLPEGARKHLRDLEKKNRELAGVVTENTQLKQREALRGAGVELNDLQFKALSTTHEGEQTPEALRKTAETLGFAQPVPEVSAETREAHDKLADARTDAQRTSDTSYEAELANAKSKEDIKALAIKHGMPWAE